MTEELYGRLAAYSEQDIYPFHMPGHKRRFGTAFNPYQLDITEIPGFDNLHHAEGILKQAQEKAARLYHSQCSFFLVNGSTGGILSAIGSASMAGDEILIARNCHKSVYHAASINRLKVHYLYPKTVKFGISGSVEPEQVEQQYEAHPGIRIVVLTSPTYDGIVSNLNEIAKIVHGHNGILIVDAAHGAHLGFHPSFPENPVRSGADFVIMSLHKTLPAFTQSGLLHVNTEKVPRAKVEHYLNMYETSSPSYLLMAGMDACLDYVAEKGEEKFCALWSNLKQFYADTAELKSLEVFHRESEERELYDADPSKILISTKKTEGSLSGKELEDCLRITYGIQLEMSSIHYATALSGILDDKEGFLRLSRALNEIDAAYEVTPKNITKSKTIFSYEALYESNKKRMEIFQAEEAERSICSIDKAAGNISGSYLYLYPPGIPMLVPGEVIGEDFYEKIQYCTSCGFQIEGLQLNGIYIILKGI
ncbi:MAG: aminotransferase class I/II-fold pyridoxal phosphate-dependent enzyme [Lachnospiraceae bacterium]